MYNETQILDRRDKQLLEVLAQNCRTSDSAIARALRVAKDTITYRRKHLEQSGLISRYVLFVDARRLGFTRFHLLIQFETNFEPESEILLQLSQHPFVMWINSFIGCFDLQVIVDARDVFHLEVICQQLFQICKQQIKHYLVLTHLSDLEFTQLNPVLDLKTSFECVDDASFGARVTRRRFPVGAEFQHCKIEALDLELLKALAENPCASLTALAEKCGCERQTVKRRVLELIRRRVILNFGAIPNVAMIGFVTYYLLVRVKQDTPVTALQKPFQELNNIFYAGRMLGEYDLILYLNARSPQELGSSIARFRKSLRRFILNYDLLVQNEVSHWRQFTSGIYQELLKSVLRSRN